MKLDNTSLSSLAVRELNPVCNSSNGRVTQRIKEICLFLAAKWCNEECQTTQIECIIDCSHDTVCVSNCNREQISCQRQVWKAFYQGTYFVFHFSSHEKVVAPVTMSATTAVLASLKPSIAGCTVLEISNLSSIYSQ